MLYWAADVWYFRLDDAKVVAGVASTLVLNGVLWDQDR
jgi:hypothetical protein